MKSDVISALFLTHPYKCLLNTSRKSGSEPGPGDDPRNRRAQSCLQAVRKGRKKHATIMNSEEVPKGVQKTKGVCTCLYTSLHTHMPQTGTHLHGHHTHTHTLIPKYSLLSFHINTQACEIHPFPLFCLLLSALLPSCTQTHPQLQRPGSYYSCRRQAGDKGRLGSQSPKWAQVGLTQAPSVPSEGPSKI